jgi:hypothetical protein
MASSTAGVKRKRQREKREALAKLERRRSLDAARQQRFRDRKNLAEIVPG